MKRTIPGLAVIFSAALIFPALSPCADESLTIPAGSTLHVRLTTTLSTRTNQNGDPWAGKVIEPIFANAQELVSGGSTAEGRVTFVKAPGRVKGVAEMRLVLETITTVEGFHYSVAAALEEAQGAEGARVKDEEGTIKGTTSKKADAVSVGVGGGVGAGVGAMGAGGQGALYGAGIGAAAMAVRSLFKRGKDIILTQGTELTFVIPRNTPGKKVPIAEDSFVH